MPDPSSSSILQIMISIFCGGLGGAIVSAFVNRNTEHEKRAIDFVDKYFSNRENIGISKWYLIDQNELKDETKANKPLKIIREVGDRFNQLAYYYNIKALKRDYLYSSGLMKDIVEFLKLIDEAQCNREIGHHLSLVGEWWPALYDLRVDLHSRGEIE